MHSLSARRVLSVCAISAASFAALLAPSVASAKAKVPPACIRVQASRARARRCRPRTRSNTGRRIRRLLDQGLRLRGAVGAPTVTYTSSGSGTALKSWGAEAGVPGEEFVGFGTNNAFLGVDEPPNETQLSNLDSQETVSPEGEKSVESIPVAQAAAAIIVHLPAGCTANSTAAAGRLSLTDAELGGIYEGTITTWGQLTDGGESHRPGHSHLPMAKCRSRSSVRLRWVGHNPHLKRFLGQIDPAPRSNTKQEKPRRGANSLRPR